jgi:hypothetical protein
MRLAAATIGAVFAWSCGSMTSGLPSGATPLVAPAIYAKWWQMVETCSGRSAPFSAISWYELSSLAVLDGGAAGVWEGRSNSIVVKTSAKFDGSLIRHEMLHSLTHSAGHLRRDFLESCAGVVVCVGPCITDAGPIPVPADSVPRVPPESLTVFSVADPVSPVLAGDSDFFSLTVFAHNPANHPVVAVLPPSGDAGPSLSFSYRITGPATIEYNDRAWDPEVTYFAAGETKRRIFDLVDRPTFDLPGAITPGAYQVQGAFGEKTEAAHALTIRRTP